MGNTMPEHNEVMEKLREILSAAVTEDAPAVTGESDLINDLGLDSMKVLEIMEALEDSFDISIPMNIMPEVRTVNDLAVEIQKLTDSE